MKYKNIKTEKRSRLKGKIRSKVSGTTELPRLSVFRSNKFIYGQLIDDTKGATIVSVSDIKSKGKGTKVASAKAMGAAIAKGAVEKGIKKVVFDRNGFKYTGRVKEFADGAREGGLIF
ncbi:MAG TPA: 50S ribosomal protein L18 [Candidatus Paceibacterota bacterium]|nr:50S ribosomal protein L18 [Candidatus Paceibacterota bacterium]